MAHEWVLMNMCWMNGWIHSTRIYHICMKEMMGKDINTEKNMQSLIVFLNYIYIYIPQEEKKCTKNKFMWQVRNSLCLNIGN